VGDRGIVRLHLGEDSRETTVIFSGCAPCNVRRLRQWSDIGLRREDRVILILDLTPDKLAGFKRANKLSGEVYSYRGLTLLRELGVERVPTAVVVTTDGIVSWVEDGSTP
jgi:hypothetical protein